MTIRPSEFVGRESDRLHAPDGEHLKVPPPGVNKTVWTRDMRKHMEGHQTDKLVRKIAPNCFPE